MKAVWQDTVIAESADTVQVEGNHYFPISALKREFVVDSATHTTCSWKGVASYYTIRVGGDENKDAAWFYPSPKKGAEEVKDRVAFWKGVKILA